MKHDTRQLTFDLGTDTAPVEANEVEGELTSRRVNSHVMAASAGSEWQEVPQARFDSWSERMQMRYCEDRDNDAAEHALTPEWREFYLQRAAAYRS